MSQEQEQQEEVPTVSESLQIVETATAPKEDGDDKKDSTEALENEEKSVTTSEDELLEVVVEEVEEVEEAVAEPIEGPEPESEVTQTQEDKSDGHIEVRDQEESHELTRGSIAEESKEEERVVVDIDDDDLLEFGTPLPDEDEFEIVYESVQSPLETQDEMFEKYAKFPIIVNTGNFPYLLAPLSQEAASRLPTEYEDALNLFDDFSFGSTIYEVFQQIRTTFKELENEFKEEDDLILSFKEFNLELKESSTYAHELTLLDIVQAFEALSFHLGPDSPPCLHLDLSCQRSFLAQFDDLLNLPPKTLKPQTAAEIGLEGEGTASKPFELSAEELNELDESLSPEESVNVNSVPEESKEAEQSCQAKPNEGHVEYSHLEATETRSGEASVESENELLSMEPTIEPEELQETSLEPERDAKKFGQPEEATAAAKRSFEEENTAETSTEEGYKRQK